MVVGGGEGRVAREGGRAEREQGREAVRRRLAARPKTREKLPAPLRPIYDKQRGFKGPKALLYRVLLPRAEASQAQVTI